MSSLYCVSVWLSLDSASSAPLSPTPTHRTASTLYRRHFDTRQKIRPPISITLARYKQQKQQTKERKPGNSLLFLFLRSVRRLFLLSSNQQLDLFLNCPFRNTWHCWRPTIANWRPPSPKPSTVNAKADCVCSFSRFTSCVTTMLHNCYFYDLPIVVLSACRLVGRTLFPYFLFLSPTFPSFHPFFPLFFLKLQFYFYVPILNVSLLFLLTPTPTLFYWIGCFFSLAECRPHRSLLLLLLLFCRFCWTWFSSRWMWIVNRLNDAKYQHDLFLSIRADSGRLVTNELKHVSRAIAVDNLTSIVSNLAEIRQNLGNIEQDTGLLQERANQLQVQSSS